VTGAGEKNMRYQKFVLPLSERITNPILVSLQNRNTSSVFQPVMFFGSWLQVTIKTLSFVLLMRLPDTIYYYPSSVTYPEIWRCASPALTSTSALGDNASPNFGIGGTGVFMSRYLSRYHSLDGMLMGLFSILSLLSVTMLNALSLSCISVCNMRYAHTLKM
jgi:hypothetical protein